MSNRVRIVALFMLATASCAGGGMALPDGASTGAGGSAATGTGGAGTGSGTGGAAVGGSGRGGASGGGGSSAGGSGGGADGGSAGRGGTAGGGAGGSRDGGTADTGGGGCSASCNAANGITIGCAKRFMYGVNYAWRNFSGDFGGSRGVAANRSTVLADLTDMRANGVDTIRWWVWPNINGQGIVLDAGGTPTGIGGTVLGDLQAALELAAQVGVHIQFTFFSFDNFKPDTASQKSIRPIVIDTAKRAALMDKAVRPFVRAVTASAQHAQSAGWDVINEPEWAISGTNGYGDPAYTPQTNLQTVTHAQMETFVTEVIAAIRKESTLPVTVGSAAAKWPKAWSRVGVDFYTVHIYDWVNEFWPYTRTPAQLDMADKPLVMGEFPLNGLTGVSYNTMVTAFFNNGWAGAMGWSVTDTQFNWPANKGPVKTFADGKGCVLRY